MVEIEWVVGTCKVCGREFYFSKDWDLPDTCGCWDCLRKWKHPTRVKRKVKPDDLPVL